MYKTFCKLIVHRPFSFCALPLLRVSTHLAVTVKNAAKSLPAVMESFERKVNNPISLEQKNSHAPEGLQRNIHLANFNWYRRKVLALVQSGVLCQKFGPQRKLSSPIR